MAVEQSEQLAQLLHRLTKIAKASAPIIGLSIIDPVAKSFAITFDASATGAQRSAATAAVTGADWRFRRLREFSSILADVDALLDTAAKDKAALHRLLAYIAMKDTAVLRTLGQAIDGDEPVP